MKKILMFAAVVSLLLTTACTTHYKMTRVSRSQIVIDQRYDASPDAQAVAFLAPYRAKVDAVMGPVVGRVAHDMAAARPESDLSNLITDIFLYMSKRYNEQPDFAVYNMGGIRAALAKGDVTYGDVLDVAPFDNKICFLTLTGDKVLELFRQIAKRGGEGVSRGVEMVIRPDGQLVSARLHGKAIDPKGSYRIATIDYIAQGNDGMTAFKSGTNLNSPQEDENNSRYVIRDFFLEMLHNGQVIDSKVEGRIRVEN